MCKTLLTLGNDLAFWFSIDLLLPSNKIHTKRATGSIASESGSQSRRQFQLQRK